MVWLSSVSTTCGSSFYFDMRFADVVTSNGMMGMLVRGVVGDGHCENWADVFIGEEACVTILPNWNDDGELEMLNVGDDEAGLHAQMQSAARGYLLGQYLPSLQYEDDCADVSYVKEEQRALAA